MSDTPANAPYDWLKQVPHALFTLDSVPLMGYAPNFPLEAFQKEIAKTFALTDFHLTISEPHWKLPNELLTGFETTAAQFHLSVSPMNSNITWVMSDHDIELLMELLLTNKESPIQTIDPDFKVGFSRFLVFEVIHLLGKVPYDKALSFNYLENVEASTAEAPCLSFDVQLSISNKSIAGRLILSPEFYQAWKKHYSQKKTDALSNPALAQKLGLILHLEAGRSSFKLSEWNSIHPGDFFILDHCSYEPGEDKGRVMITVGGHPYFRAKLKQGNIKILEFPLYHEVHAPMNSKPADEDEDFDHDEDSELEDDFGEDFELDDDFDFDEDTDLDEEHEEATELEEKGADEEEELAPAKSLAAKETTKAQTSSEHAKTPPKVEEMTIHVVVEVGRIEMSVQKFLELQPGNMLELDVKPENGVDLVVNGKYLGKGELLRVGEALGVRVLDIG